MGDRFLAILPTYNESENLPKIVPQILAQDPRLDVLVVDDSSPDGTGRLADELAAAEPRVHVLHREHKAGLGRAYPPGVSRALGAGGGWGVCGGARGPATPPPPRGAQGRPGPALPRRVLLGAGGGLRLDVRDRRRLLARPQVPARPDRRGRGRRGPRHRVPVQNRGQ